MSSIAARCAIAVAIVLVAGCAREPLPRADEVAAAAAKTFTPGTDSANVYVYRNEILGGIVRMAVMVDGKEVGITRGLTYLLLRLEPGRHTIVSQGQTRFALTFDVAAGKNYFVWQEVKHNPLLFTYRSQLKLVDEATGQEGVKECELVTASQ
jgi:hypothetical protein